jgi:hypothetical protein
VKAEAKLILHLELSCLFFSSGKAFCADFLSDYVKIIEEGKRTVASRIRQGIFDPIIQLYSPY